MAISEMVIIIRGVVNAPSKTFAVIADSRTWRDAAPIYVLAAIAGWLVSLLRPSTANSANATVIAFLRNPVLTFTTALLGPVLILPLIAIGHWAARQQGGQGAFARLYTVTLIQEATTTLARLPALLLIYIFTRLSSTFAFMMQIGDFIDFAIGCWGVYLSYCGLRAAMRLERREAINALLITLGVVVLLIVSLSCSAGVVAFVWMRKYT